MVLHHTRGYQQAQALKHCRRGVAWRGWALFAPGSQLHPGCLGTAIRPLSSLKLYLLPFLQGTKVHPFKHAAVEEEVCSSFWLDKAKTSVCH